MKKAVEESLKALGCTEIIKRSSVGGGCINESYCYVTDKGKFFVKTNEDTNSFAMFEGEMKGLQAIQQTNTVRVPKPITVGSVSGKQSPSFIIMEYIEFGSTTRETEKKLGQQLAALHLSGDEKRFGFHVDNTIGSTPQINTWCDDWVEFFSKYRLGYQLNLAKKYKDKELNELGGKLLLKLPEFFTGLSIKPALLHGDLWSGNWSADKDGNPVIFDPACYYGHSEAELSIMGMFGGFSSAFYDEYHKHIPKEKGFEARLSLYQLYHYLNHMNIFGGYRSPCIRILKDLLH